MSCPVCYENILPESTYTTKCNHVFCKDCIVVNNLDKCPLCRESINIYLDHLSIDDLSNEDLYNTFKQILDTKSCRDLTFTKELLYILQYILAKQNIIDYFLNREDNSAFVTTYSSCIIENQNVFKHYSNKYEDFALTMLFYKYH